MILMDTCALIFDALSPDRLSDKALQAIDRIIAASAIHYRGKLVTCDVLLRSVEGLEIVW